MNPIHNKNDTIIVSPTTPTTPISISQNRIQDDIPKDSCIMNSCKIMCFPCNYVYRKRLYIYDTFIDMIHIVAIVLCCSHDETMRHDSFQKKTQDGLFDNNY